MPLELVNHDILSCLDETPAFIKGTIGSGWTVSGRLSGKVNSTEPEAVAPYGLSRVRHAGQDMVKVDLKQNYTWFRIEHTLSAKTLTAGAYRLKVSYLSDHVLQKRLPQIKIIEYTKAGGQTFAKISSGLPSTKTLRNTDIEFELKLNAHEDREYRLCLEMSQPGGFCFGELSLIRHSDDPSLIYQHVAPYRVHDFRFSKELRELNDRMDSELRKSPQDWAVRMLGVSLRLEDYETASGLARYIRRHHGEDKDAMAKASPSILDTLMALGDLDEVRRFLVDMATMGITNDSLAQVGRILATTLDMDADKPLRQSRSYGLPSGKLDVFNLVRDTEFKRVSFEQMISLPSPSDVAPLLWANYLRHFSETDYLARLNGYLGSHGSPFHVELNASADNILKRVSFRQQRPMQGLIADGPLVSVVIAVWNSEDTLEYAIRSILGQQYRNIEILVADDASTDETSKELRKFSSDSRVRIFRSSRNQGPYNIRNRLISEARGELITFHDADDIAMPHRIAAQVTAMIESSARVSMGSWLRIKPNGHIVAFRDGQFLRMCVNSIMFTRTIFDKFGGYRSVLCGADSEFLELARGHLPARQIISLPQPLVLGLWGSGSLTRTAGIEADELGYRAPSRRVYAGLAGRQRVLGRMIITDATIENATANAGILRHPAELSLREG